MTINSDSGNENPTAQAAQEEAGQVADKAQDAAREVTGTAREEARQVADEATEHVKSLGASAQDELFSQASVQQQRLAEQSRTVTDDIHRISRGERPESDLVTRFVSMAAQRAEDFTTQLENKQPKELLNDVRRFAARRPGAFLAIAAGVGLVAGRLTRGLSDNDDDEGSDTASPSTGNAPVAGARPPAAATPPTATPLYDETAELALGTAPGEPEQDVVRGGSVINPEERR